MYYDSDLQRKQQEEAFINYNNLDIEKFLHKTQSDVLIEQFSSKTSVEKR